MQGKAFTAALFFLCSRSFESREVELVCCGMKFLPRCRRGGFSLMPGVEKANYAPISLD